MAWQIWHGENAMQLTTKIEIADEETDIIVSYTPHWDNAFEIHSVLRDSEDILPDLPPGVVDVLISRMFANAEKERLRQKIITEEGKADEIGH